MLLTISVIYRQNLLHIETLNMMTKYQLVFVKLETAVVKILATIQARKKLRMKKALYKFKTKVMQQNIR